MCRKRRKKKKINYFRICVSIIIIGLLMTGAYTSISRLLPFGMDRSHEKIRIPLSDIEERNTLPLDEEQEEINLDVFISWTLLWCITI
ncbi:hypothetical protein [Alkaliphilus transvaalensis]|uniref:hypothetical protein n=1 Tax=Alkaliphilus transvaalensis TaxID=114628 RepID=UPI00047CBF99|nr:hypothetical protein [Alkaliphilus transvaalensis]